MGKLVFNVQKQKLVFLKNIMTWYRNLSGESGVLAYEIGADFIIVQFRGSTEHYHYTNNKPGSVHVQKMKELATAGRGLNTYIGRYVKKNYDRKV